MILRLAFIVGVVLATAILGCEVEVPLDVPPRDAPNGSGSDGGFGSSDGGGSGSGSGSDAALGSGSGSGLDGGGSGQLPDAM